ncbi:hypothetical protein GCM10007094_33690 [Pseudovibrio japonicus]|uniref:Glycosyltransferase 2-like domain-containing protein n=1 Tax=Pseudovibrio japonicus TaxID=366534 RepID=A0ABQ3EIR1_9HYPH|nr:glycosyltransferase [Pseudovibrio japonicus]GHB41508.1 hypothetical protein GCM10007094_33690 [Pseudovibrio japonicus]
MHEPLEKQKKIIRQTKQVHSNWYRQTYPDVAKANIDPAEHYLKYGAAMGRNPGKGFQTNFYLETYPDVAEAEMNPLVHFALHGEKKGYKRRSPYKSREEAKEKLRLKTLRTNLLSFGFTEQAPLDLEDMLDKSPLPHVRASAARELALWNMRSNTDEGYKVALRYLERSREEAPDLSFRQKLATSEVLCQYFLGDRSAMEASYEQACLSGELSPDLLLAWANHAEAASDRCLWINEVLGVFDISPIKMTDDVSLSPYDRLTSAEELLEVTDGPRVTVLLAAYNAADTLPTALRSLQEQTWKNLEVLVIDDCSPDGGETCNVVEKFGAGDPRIKLLRMEVNGGAYVARNHALDQATGEYITIHDADDWSHPKKIEVQARYLARNSEIVGCTSQQARALSDLTFTRWTGSGQFIITNTSSFMFRREPMREHLGYWDTVRFSADNELIRRMRKVFGKEAVPFLNTGPYSFQRHSDTSIVADEVMGVNGFMFGARKEYLDAQNFNRNNRANVQFTNDISVRPFPAPVIMRPDRKRINAKASHIPVITGSEFRMPGGSVQSSIEELQVAHKFGIPSAVFELRRYDLGFSTESPSQMKDNARQQIFDTGTRILTFGEKVSCDLLILRDPLILHHFQRYVPTIDAKEIKVIVNQPPMSDYSSEGVLRYHVKECAENIRRYFGKDATWHPIGPLIRDTLHEHHASDLRHINFSDEDWSNIIDIKGWYRGPRKRSPNDTLRIGRHSHDDFVKWPATRTDLLAAYPDTDDVEVHVLGGGNAPRAMIGELPTNWTVHSFGSMEPKDFLAKIDVFIYYPHPDGVESFGRNIIEAMAVGVPVILPREYSALFEDAALYSAPDEAVDLARKLHKNPEAYDKQVEKALQYVEKKFSYETHLARLKKLGVEI